MSGPNWRLNDDLKTVTVTFPTEPPVQLVLDVSLVDEMLAHLGEFRALMSPQHPPVWTPNVAVKAIADPVWYSESEVMQGNSLLHLRDPRYGWLHYEIPREGAKQLGQYLIAQADTPPPGNDQNMPH